MMSSRSVQLQSISKSGGLDLLLFRNRGEIKVQLYWVYFSNFQKQYATRELAPLPLPTWK